MREYLLVAMILAQLGASCSGDETISSTSPPGVTTSPVLTSPVTTSPVVTSPVATSPATTSPIVDVPAVLADFGIGTVRLDGTELLVAIARDSRLRVQGLMGVTDLGSLDGMVFIWDEDTDSSFWMKDTLIPLDIAWFDAAGRFVSQLTMPPCGDEEVCPTYAADTPYRFALEMPEGTIPGLSEPSLLELVEGF